MMRGVRFSLMLAGAGTIISGAQAQSTRPVGLPPGAVVQSLVPDQGAELRRHLTVLADNPRSLEALIGAGRAALAGGDAIAALSFFSRAQEVAPRDPRVKAGMASVLVRMERGQPALNLFAEAAALGAPALEIAGDRGLAHDMVGDPRRAQQDYALVLSRREDPEVRRRLALSLAISGEKDAALRAIEGQLRRNDRAAWRTQAFVLALTGDAAGATRTAQGLMPPAAVQAMAPFFARLATLSPSQKAMAAHFGRFPNGSAMASAGNRDTRADPGALALAGGQPGRPRTQPVDTAATRRRPGSTETEVQPPGRAPVSRPAQTREATTAARQPEARPARQAPASTSGGRPSLMQQRRALAELERRGSSQIASSTRRPAAGDSVQPRASQPSAPAPRQDPPVSRPIVTTPVTAEPRPIDTRPAQPVVTRQFQPPVVSGQEQTAATVSAADLAPAGSFELSAGNSSQSSYGASDAANTTSGPQGPSSSPAIRQVEIPSAPASAVPVGEQLASLSGSVSPSISSTAPAVTENRPETTAPAPQPTRPAGGLSDIAALVADLPEEERPAPAVQGRGTNPPAPARTAAATAAPRTQSAPARTRSAHPSRHWVQIAGGANAAALPRELARLRSQAPELANRNAWVTPLNATNRLLVGPFASVAEAQAFVNQLAQRNISAFAWTSEAGQEIARLQAGR